VHACVVSQVMKHSPMVLQPPVHSGGQGVPLGACGGMPQVAPELDPLEALDEPLAVLDEPPSVPDELALVVPVLAVVPEAAPPAPVVPPPGPPKCTPGELQAAKNATPSAESAH
jgi:hypothetical protein